jgi:hypothetical protein
LLLAVLPGCQGDGLSEYQREQNKQEERMSALRAQGVEVTEKNYRPHGKGYVVNLSGAQLTDDTFRKLKDLQRITELDLSKSSLADEQMDRLNEVAYLLVKLDLSNTPVTDTGLEKLTNLNLCFNLNPRPDQGHAGGSGALQERTPRTPGHQGQGHESSVEVGAS